MSYDISSIIMDLSRQLIFSFSLSLLSLLFLYQKISKKFSHHPIDRDHPPFSTQTWPNFHTTHKHTHTHTHTLTHTHTHKNVNYKTLISIHVQSKKNQKDLILASRIRREKKRSSFDVR